jgi:hypothetical protein
MPCSLSQLILSSFRTYAEAGDDRNSAHAFRIFLIILLTSGSRKNAKPDGVPCKKKRCKISVYHVCESFVFAYHGPVQDGVERSSYHADRVIVVTPLRCCMKDMIENFKHVVIVAHLLVAEGIILVWLLHWYLLEHRVDEDIDPGILLKQVFELLQDRVKLFGVVLDAVDNVGQPLLVNAVIRGEPVPGPVQLMLVGHIFRVLLV